VGIAGSEIVGVRRRQSMADVTNSNHGNYRVLRWRCFDSMTAARDAAPRQSCVYVHTDPDGHPVRVGKASRGLSHRYPGGNAGAMDAGMDGSGNLIYTAWVPRYVLGRVEAELIWEWKPRYNQLLKTAAPAVGIQLCLRAIHPTSRWWRPTAKPVRREEGMGELSARQWIFLPDPVRHGSPARPTLGESAEAVPRPRSGEPRAWAIARLHREDEPGGRDRQRYRPRSHLSDDQVATL
jgi:hypothetical protein